MLHRTKISHLAQCGYIFQSFTVFRAVSLLLEALEENNKEIVYNAVVSLANIAMHHGNHELLLNSGAVEKLRRLIPRESK